MKFFTKLINLSTFLCVFVLSFFLPTFTNNIINLKPISSMASLNYISNIPSSKTFKGSYQNHKKSLKIAKKTSPIVVAVIDSGVNVTHPDLKNNILTGYNIFTKDSTMYDGYKHGTHITGIILGASKNYDFTTINIDYCNILPVKVLNDDGGGTSSFLAKGIKWAADNNARILNISMGFKKSSLKNNNLINSIKYAQNKGILIIAAAGNDDSNIPEYPAAFENVLAVSSVNKDNEKSHFSNYGEYIDICAPGEEILSTLNSDFSKKSGTSMSTAFVSRAAALIWSQNPSLTANEVSNILISSSTDLGKKGTDIYFGYGKLNVLKSMESMNTSKK